MTTFPYKRTLSGNVLPIVDLKAFRGNKSIILYAVVDSGATVSIFRPSVAKLLGIDILTGKDVTLGGIGGGIKGYLFNIQIAIAGKTFSAPIVFSLEFQAPFNLLGRDTVFEQFTITFDEKRQLLTFT